MSRILTTTSLFQVDGNPALDELARRGLEIRTNPYGRRLSEDEAAVLLADGVIGVIAGVEPLTRRVLEGASDLKIISRCGIGMDSVDLEAAEELGMLVCNTPDAPSQAAAELTLALMLSALRRVAETDRALRRGTWKPLMGGLMAACTVGVVGYGRIGRRVAALAAAFGARILAHDPHVCEFGDGVEPVSLPSLLADADIVCLHLPGGVGQVIDDAAIAVMKPEAILVNAARGDLVDETAVERALCENRLGGFACDTYQSEPYEGPLTELENTVLTCHMGSYAREARGAMEREAASNLLDGLIEAGAI